MSATLNLRLEKGLRGMPVQEGVVTNVYGLTDQGKRDPSRDHRNVVVPAGYGTQPLSLPVDAGAYVVEAVLPSGDTTSERIHVPEGADVSLNLESPHSPHEWLSWQQFIGNVPQHPDEEPKAEPAAKRPRRPTGGRKGNGGRGGGGGTRYCLRADSFRPGGGGGGISRYGGDINWGGGVTLAEPEVASRRASRVPPAPVVWFLGSTVPGLRDNVAGKDAWKLIANRQTRMDPFSTLTLESPVRARRTPDRDQHREVLAFGAGGQSTNPAQDATGGNGYVPRRYLVSVQTGGPVELACLPVPWDSLEVGRVPIEVLVRRQPSPGEAAVAMSPADPGTRVAIGYMASGRLTDARVLFDRAKAMLFGKMMNPMSAAAGGYVLLATEHGPGVHEWHQWIENLANSFKWLPDGMIQYGRLRLQRRKTDGDVEAARDAFFEAYRRGIPFYSLGLQWLVEGLSLLATAKDPEAARILGEVQEVTWKANLQQPFTTIRLRTR